MSAVPCCVPCTWHSAMRASSKAESGEGCGAQVTLILPPLLCLAWSHTHPWGVWGLVSGKGIKVKGTVCLTEGAKQVPLQPPEVVHTGRERASSETEMKSLGCKRSQEV